jgi:ornithine cyclodeaminase/alanine dehydrogenase-like protein (mu-crystallin family)
LGRVDIERLMAPGDYIAPVEAAFRAAKEGRAEAPFPMRIPAVGGAFHAKGALLRDGRDVVAVKVNANFPGNPARGLPTIQGAILLADAQDGSLLALLDSIEITARRTAAASAIAAKHLARKDASRLGIVGCGGQARAQVEALCSILPLRAVLAFDLDRAKASAFSADMEGRLGVRVETASDMRNLRTCDVIVTCTTSRAPFLEAAHVGPGAFVAAVGADDPEKSEIAPALMGHARIVVDVLDQCLDMGDLRHAVAAGAVTAGDVHADLGGLVTGERPGRVDDREVFVFDSTGVALQDAACALAVQARALERGIGVPFAFA